MMHVAKCRIDGCQWSQARDSAAAALKLRERHELLRHPDVYGVGTNQPIDTHVEQLPTVEWRTQGLDVIASQPAGARFTLYEICAHLGEPPTANGWQHLARDAHFMGLITDVGGVNSKRPGTKGSKTTLWRRTEVALNGRRTA